MNTLEAKKRLGDHVLTNGLAKVQSHETLLSP